MQMTSSYIQETYWNIMMWGKNHGDKISSWYVCSQFGCPSLSGIAHSNLVGLNLDKRDPDFEIWGLFIT